MTIEATLLNTFGSGTLGYALAIGVDPTTGDVVVGDESPYTIHRFSASGELLDQYSKPAGIDGSISGVAVDDSGDIWISDFYPNGLAPRIYRLSPTGALEAGYFDQAYPDTLVMEPNDISIGPDGKFYVASTNWYGITPDKTYGLRLSAGMAFEEQYGTGYTGDYETLPPNGQVLVPVGIVADSLGNVFVSDGWGWFKTITKFSSDGTFVSRFGGVGSGDGQFTRWTTGGGGFVPEIWYYDAGMKMAVDAEDRLFVVDRQAGRVNVFDNAGTSLGAFGTGDIERPQSVAIGTDGTIYVLDEWNQQITQWEIGGVPEFLIRGVSVVVCGDTDC